jgi:hypothetical protein
MTLPNNMKEDLRVKAVKKHDFKTPQTLFALIFQHSNGWTFLEFFKTANEAVARLWLALNAK